MSIETLPRPEIEEHEISRYALTDEQISQLPEPAKVAYFLETDSALKEFSIDNQTVTDRLMQLTAFDHDTLVKANRHLSSHNDRKAQLAGIERDDNGGIRFKLTEQGIRYLDIEVTRVSGVIVDTE